MPGPLDYTPEEIKTYVDTSLRRGFEIFQMISGRPVIGPFEGQFRYMAGLFENIGNEFLFEPVESLRIGLYPDVDDETGSLKMESDIKWYAYMAGRCLLIWTLYNKTLDKKGLLPMVGTKGRKYFEHLAVLDHEKEKNYSIFANNFRDYANAMNFSWRYFFNAHMLQFLRKNLK